MSQHKSLYIGYNDEGNELHGFIDYADFDHIEEYSEQQLADQCRVLDNHSEKNHDLYLLKKRSSIGNAIYINPAYCLFLSY